MIAALLRLFGGGLAEQLRLAYQARLQASNEADRLDVDLRIKVLEADLQAQANAKEVRLATAGFWEMRLLVAIAGYPAAIHFGAVCFASMMERPFIVHALPSPMDEWQGAIILSLFGLSAAGLAARVLARRR